ncbi:MAG: radical SAM protein [Fusobacteriaceae bacterium]
MYKYVFGPVPSRRLGISLGIDLVDAKTCNFNCVYCECGATKEYKVDRKKYIDIDILKNEIIKIMKHITPDYITFSGNGEPTLNLELGDVVKWIKQNYNVKTALITNASLLHLDEVLENVMFFDTIIPTLNAVTEEVFKKINRAESKCHIEEIKIGLKKLSERYNGDIFIENFIIEGINDGEVELEKYAEFLKTIRYTKLQLNSLARPGAEKWVKPVSYKCMEHIKKFFEDKNIREVEIIGKFKELENKIMPNEELIQNMQEKRKYSEVEMKKMFIK